MGEKSDLERAADILRSFGIRLEVGACGCCSSPWFKMEYQGEIICDAMMAELNMFDGEE